MSGVCNEADSGGPLGGEDREDPSLTELQRLRPYGKQVWMNISIFSGSTSRGGLALDQQKHHFDTFHRIELLKIIWCVFVYVCVQLIVSRSDPGENRNRV